MAAPTLVNPGVGGDLLLSFLEFATVGAAFISTDNNGTEGIILSTIVYHSWVPW